MIQWLFPCRVSTPIEVAHKVLTESPHSVLVGAGAQKFAREHGFTIEPNDNLLPPSVSKSSASSAAQDTLGVIVLDQNRNIAAGKYHLRG